MCVRTPQVDQAALTGESLPVKKFSGNVAFSGSAIKQGEKVGGLFKFPARERHLWLIINGRQTTLNDSVKVA